jgi:hypothetical protein
MIPYLHIMRLSSGFILSLLVSFSAGCSKDTPESVSGNLSLEISALHHSWGVPNLPVFLKKNANDFPGEDTSIYEYSTLTDNNGSALFDQLHPGNYYVYAKGYDLIWADTVIGKKNIRLVTSTRLTLPVSE